MERWKRMKAKGNAPPPDRVGGMDVPALGVVASRSRPPHDPNNRLYVMKDRAAKLVKEPAQRIGLHLGQPRRVPVIERLLIKGAEMLQSECHRPAEDYDAEKSEHDSMEVQIRIGHVAQTPLRQVQHDLSANPNVLWVRGGSGLPGFGGGILSHSSWHVSPSPARANRRRRPRRDSRYRFPSVARSTGT